MKNVRSSQPCVWMNFCTEFSKAQIFPVSIVKRLSVYIPVMRFWGFINHSSDPGDTIYDKPNEESFKNKIENIQYKACIAITGAIQETSREHFYQELGWQSLKDRRWYQKLIFFHKFVNGATTRYLTIWTPLITQFTTQQHQTKIISEVLGQELNI